MRVPFSKYQGLGNDFVIVDDVPVGALDVPAICHRRTGVGADGVLFVARTDDGFSMRVVNSDGSMPQMCGNGLRCVVWHLGRTDRWPGGRVPFETGAGVHEAELHGDEDVEVWMAPPTFEPRDIPCSKRLLDTRLEFAGEPLRVTAVGMGNPHAVLFDARQPERLGPLVQSAALFPEGVNVGFASGGGDAITLRVLERGAGWTDACGTGACAAVAAAVETKRSTRGSAVRVSLPGGDLTIVIGEPGEPARMRGAAAFVFDGVLAARYSKVAP